MDFQIHHPRPIFSQPRRWLRLFDWTGYPATWRTRSTGEIGVNDPGMRASVEASSDADFEPLDS